MRRSGLAIAQIPREGWKSSLMAGGFGRLASAIKGKKKCF